MKYLKVANTLAYLFTVVKLFSIITRKKVFCRKNQENNGDKECEAFFSTHFKNKLVRLLLIDAVTPT